MSDNTPSAPTYPPYNIPTVYADGVLNLSNTSHVVKMYLTRVDPAYDSSSAPGRNQIFAQLTMPIDAFAQTALFFEQALQNLVNANIIPKAYVDQLRAVFAPAE